MRNRQLPALILLLAASIAAVGLSRAQAPPATAAPAPTAETSATGPAPAATPAATPSAEPPVASEDEADKAPARPPASVGATPGRFEPTEKVRADFDVSFPVDI